MPEAILWGLGEWALRATVLAAVVGLLLWGLRVKDASLRLAAWTTVLLGTLLLPMAVLVPQFPIPVPRPPVKIELGNPQNADRPGTVVTQNTSDAKSVPSGRPVVPAQNFPARTLDPLKTHTLSPGNMASNSPLWPKVIIGFWLVIAAVMLFRLLLGLWFSRGLVDASTVIEEGIRESSAITVPVTAGLVSPVILLPADWRDWDEQKLRAVLAHEQSHVSRHDPLCQLAASVYCAVCWFHPLAWWLSAKLAECAEAASDDAALLAVPGHVQYAEILLGFLERAPRRVQWAGIPMAKKDTAARRIDRILDSHRRLSISLTPRAVLILVLLAGPVIYLAAALRPVWASPSVLSSPVVGDANPTENFSAAGHESAQQRAVPVPERNEISPRQTPLVVLAQKSSGNQKDNGKETVRERRLTDSQTSGSPAQKDGESNSSSGVPQSLSAPTQLSPPNGAAWSANTYPRTTKFQWTIVPGATSYGIEINCFTCCVRGKWCSDVGGVTHIVRGLTEPAYTMDGFYGSQPGSWRVWAIHDKSDGPASPWWEFSYSATNDPMRFPPLPSNNAPPAEPAVRAVSPVSVVTPAPKDGAIGPDRDSALSIPAVDKPPSASTPIYSQGQVSTPIKAIYSPDPDYTDAARKAKITGIVGIYVVVGPDGLVKQASITKSLTPDLDESALSTIKTWRFEPARKDGVPVSSSGTIQVSFSLR